MHCAIGHVEGNHRIRTESRPHVRILWTQRKSTNRCSSPQSHKVNDRSVRAAESLAMECPNCSFQNMPGQVNCVRCQSRLNLATVDYLPPRAGDRALTRGIRRSATRTAVDV